MRLPVLSIQDAVERQLCTGCGACEAIAGGSVAMVNVPGHGNRPTPTRSWKDVPGIAARVCPGVQLRRPELDAGAEIAELRDEWGPVRDVCEGHASDEAIRTAASSGGAATAIALFAIERYGFYGVLHAAARPDKSWLNHTVMSSTREQLLANTGSRYAPASPCEELQQIERAPEKCVFIGKPCDVAAVAKMRLLRPALDQNVGLTISFFCAGTPTTEGTLELLSKVGVSDPDSVQTLRYRGNGWPGRWTVRFSESGGKTHERTLSYEESWAALERHRPWRCRICPDHTGEFADIAVGDAWSASPDGRDPGRSLIIARTQRGADFINAAVQAGYLNIVSRDHTALERSQPELLRARASVWGRIISMRLAGLRVPEFQGFDLFRAWRRLTLRDMLRSTVGTFRRMRRYRLNEPVIAASCERAAPSRPACITEPKEAICNASVEC